MIREFLFKVLVQMYNQNFFKLKSNKMLDKLNISINKLKINIKKMRKFF